MRGWQQLASFSAAWLLCGFAAAAAPVQSSRFLSELEREKNPVKRARKLPKLGEAELDRVRDLTAIGKYDEAQATIEEYLEGVESTFAALKATGINAEKKSSGFKHLQIHLRRSARQLTDIIAALPFERRKPFQEVHDRVEVIDNELIDMLFPRQPGRKTTSGRQED